MKKNLRTSYAEERVIESFFTGNSILFDQDGNHFFCSNGCIVNKVSIDDGQIKSQYSKGDDEDAVIALTKSHDDKLLIVAYYSGLIVKFSLENGTIEREFRTIHKAPISIMRVDPSNTYLATASSDGTIKLWNLVNHYCSHNFKGIHGVVSSMLFTTRKSGDVLLASGGDYSIYVFEINTSKLVTKLSRHCSVVTDLLVFSNTQTLVSIGRDQIAVVWDISDHLESTFGTALKTIPLYESVESIVKVSGEHIRELVHVQDKTKGPFFATVGEEGRIKIWDCTTGAKIVSQNEPPLSDDRSPGTACLQICERPGRDQLCAVSIEKDIFLYNLPNLTLSQQLQGHIDQILSACWFGENKYIALACNSADLKTFEIKTSKCRHHKGHQGTILRVKTAPWDPMFVISSSRDCHIIVWKFDHDTMNSTIVFKAEGHTHDIRAIGIAISERNFFTGGDDMTIKRWSVPNYSNQKEVFLTPNQAVRPHDNGIEDISVSPNDELIATASRDKTAKVLDSLTLRTLGTLSGHKRAVNSVKFSPQDQALMTAAAMDLKLWNLKDFTCVKTLQGHECIVLNFTFLSSGLQVMSVGSDGNLKLWNLATRECMKTIDAHSGITWALEMTEDDKFMISGGQDQKLVIWRDSTSEEREERQMKIETQLLQEQDLSNYINKKKWTKAFKLAVSMHNPKKTLDVVREFLLQPNGSQELEKLLVNTQLDHLDFLIDCCVTWSSTANNCYVGQLVLNILIRRTDNQSLVRMPSLKRSISQLRALTQKASDRYERLFQEAVFADFFVQSFKIDKPGVLD